MIQSNLSTRPFYNDRAVRLWLMVGLLIVVAATVFNVSRIVYYSGSNTELAAAASRDERRAAEIRAEAARLRGSVDPTQIEVASLDARQANDLIDRRTFSWTELFNRFETTLPPDVRITSVRPSIDKDRQIVLTFSVVARSVDDVNAFMENLDATGAFVKLTPTTERMNEEGQVESVLESVYVPHPAPAADTAKPASEKSPSRPGGA
jgi:Tfp pilus assembly protein PilN